jgi:hypothetical protein
MVQPQFKGQTYGEATAQERRVQAVPTGKSPTETQAQKMAKAAPQPNAPGSLASPTVRPNEPITAGASFGEGPGPEVLPVPIAPALGSQPDLVERVRVIAAQFPNAALLGLLAELESQ